MTRRTKQEFIENAIKIHGNDYDYSNSTYITNKTKLEIKCNTCENIFHQRPDSHLFMKRGCPYCGGTKKTLQEDFIKKCNKKHGNKYDYSLVKYINYKTKIEIICNTCDNIFYQNAFDHVNGRGCSVCAKVSSPSNEEYILKAVKIHGSKYDYSEVEYVRGRSKIKIKCNTCDNIFNQSAEAHVCGQGCPKCGNITRLGFSI